jgi:hypothetical protein
VTVPSHPEQTVPAWSAPDTIVATALMVFAGIVCAAAIVRRPDLTSEGFLFGDAGVNLLLAERLLAGARLYRDAGFSYGPLAIYPYQLFGGVFGITPQSFSAFLALFSVANVGLAYRALRTAVSRRAATLVVVVGLYPTILLPGSLVFGNQSSAYFVLERTFFLGVLLLWTPPESRTTARAASVGALLGVWQGLRFGTSLFVGAAIVLVDLLALLHAGGRRPDMARWFRLSLITFCAFIAVEATWAIYAFSSLPRGDALDFLWPSYVLEAFAAWPSERRWPRWEGLRFFVGQQLIVVASAAFGAIVLASFLHRRARADWLGFGDRRRRLTPGDLRLMLPFAFFAVGTVALFRSVYHFHQYAWTLVLTAAIAMDRGGPWIRRGFALLCLPSLAILLRANLVTAPPPDATAVRTANGGSVTLNPAGKNRIDALLMYARANGGTSLLIMQTNAGFHALFNTRFSGRQFFYILGFARGRDEEHMLNTLASEPAAIVLTDYPLNKAPSANPCEWYGWPHFRADFCPRLARSVDIERAVQIDGTTWIIPAAGTSLVPTSKYPNATPDR